MDFNTLFGLFYNRYRGESIIPGITDDEWKIGVRNYNDAIHRLVTMDDTKWNFLWSTNQIENEGDALTAVDTDYDAPGGMLEPGGILTFIDSNGKKTTSPILTPHEVQVTTAKSSYGYFTGDPQNGWTLHINPLPTTAQVGMLIDYDLYKNPPLLDPDTEDGSSIIIGGDPAYFYNHMLANRFLNTNNYPSYQVAVRDSEAALNGMKLKNNSGTYYRPWSLMDTSGTGWGTGPGTWR